MIAALSNATLILQLDMTLTTLLLTVYSMKISDIEQEMWPLTLFFWWEGGISLEIYYLKLDVCPSL